MALLGDGPIMDPNKNGNNVPEQVHFIVIHCNAVHNGYLQNRKLLYTFVSNNASGYYVLLNQKNYYSQKQQILSLITLKFGLLIRITL